MTVSHNRLRQHRWELDERRRFLAGLEALAARLRRDAQRLHWEIEEETGAGRSEQCVRRPRAAVMLAAVASSTRALAQARTFSAPVANPTARVR